MRSCRRKCSCRLNCLLQYRQGGTTLLGLPRGIEPRDDAGALEQMTVYLNHIVERCENCLCHLKRRVVVCGVV